jgi:hypothetical protein
VLAAGANVTGSTNKIIILIYTPPSEGKVRANGLLPSRDIIRVVLCLAVVFPCKKEVAGRDEGAIHLGPTGP